MRVLILVVVERATLNHFSTEKSNAAYVCTRTMAAITDPPAGIMRWRPRVLAARCGKFRIFRLRRLNSCNYEVRAAPPDALAKFIDRRSIVADARCSVRRPSACESVPTQRSARENLCRSNRHPALLECARTLDWLCASFLWAYACIASITDVHLHIRGGDICVPHPRRLWTKHCGYAFRNGEFETHLLRCVPMAPRLNITTTTGH